MSHTSQMATGTHPGMWNARTCINCLRRTLALAVRSLFGAVLVTMGAWSAAQASGIQVSPASLNFGNQPVNTTSAAQVFKVTNTQTTPVKITKVLSGNAFAQWNNCLGTLPPSSSCTIWAVFTPTASGKTSGGVTITDNATNSPQKIDMSGYGLPPALTLSPIALVFSSEEVGNTSGEQTVTITNNQTTPVTITSLAVGGAAAGDFSVPSACTGSLAGGANCNVPVTFTPTAGGVRVATLSVNNSAGPAQTSGLGGTATVGALSLSTSTITFPSQNLLTTSKSMPVTITNSGATGMDIFSIIASGDFAQTNDCPASLGEGASCTVSVTFSPSAAGQRTGYLTISDTGNSNLQTVDLSGSGVSPTSSVAVTPSVASLTPSQQQQFQATVNGVASTAVNWLVDGVVGGTPSTGRISASGLYTAAKSPGTHVITAQSQANTSESANAGLTITNYPGVFTFHYDTYRTGQNVNETVLTAGNVNPNQFGKRFSYPIDGYVYGQPLYVEAVNITDQGTHNVVYVATEHDSVYAFDADGLVNTPLWHTSFIDPAAGVTTIPGSDVNMDGCQSIGPEVGITSTPVIDNVHGVLYVLARTLEGDPAVYVQRLHALNITTGAEMPNSPVVIGATAPGIGMGTVDNVVAFNSRYQNQRAALLLSGGVVYIGWASLCDYGPYHGWLLGYDASTIKQVSSYITTPNAQRGGLWGSGGGPAVDGNGYIYLITANGTFDVNSGGSDYGDSYVKLSPGNGSLSVADYFTPYTQAILGGTLDLDLGSGGPLLLPNAATSPQQLMLGIGKDGVLYLVDRANMGHFNNSDNNQIVESIPGAAGNGSWGKAAYWYGQVYLWGLGDVLKSFRLENDLLSLAPIVEGKQTSGYPNPTPAVSANGNANGVVWVVRTNAWKTGGPAVLYAYDAANISRVLYSSTTNSKRDQAGPAVRFTIPTVANGKVYVTSQTELDVYGLLP
jgi:hypothetical protein